MSGLRARIVGELCVSAVSLVKPSDTFNLRTRDW